MLVAVVVVMGWWLVFFGVSCYLFFESNGWAQAGEGGILWRRFSR